MTALLAVSISKALPQEQAELIADKAHGNGDSSFSSEWFKNSVKVGPNNQDNWGNKTSSQTVAIPNVNKPTEWDLPPRNAVLINNIMAGKNNLNQFNDEDAKQLAAPDPKVVGDGLNLRLDSTKPLNVFDNWLYILIFFSINLIAYASSGVVIFILNHRVKVIESAINQMMQHKYGLEPQASDNRPKPIDENRCDDVESLKGSSQTEIAPYIKSGLKCEVILVTEVAQQI
jgi:hypothetical protein